MSIEGVCERERVGVYISVCLKELKRDKQLLEHVKQRPKIVIIIDLGIGYY